ncbi:hypothetical protein IQ260_30070 [Leptolyngbya cf. ectocarpi LEGE 11479]|uniref:Uncharacterized protein n=1 Tax=Leptolyngbya cf. ectocarpi LEGE 11479 TaxID=1828722 RepID=A0A929A0N1_LEPEC|nr:hypothetical protein [Leptolyngbya ectocarpi]MBE9070887.1 hypothetical protein [Leptolyngbya cf. ectocarpi LEGE 11479]
MAQRPTISDPGSIAPLTIQTKLGYGVGEMSKEIPNSILVFFLLFFFANVVGRSLGLAVS